MNKSQSYIATQLAGRMTDEKRPDRCGVNSPRPTGDHGNIGNSLPCSGRQICGRSRPHPRENDPSRTGYLLNTRVRQCAPGPRRIRGRWCRSHSYITPFVDDPLSFRVRTRSRIYQVRLETATHRFRWYHCLLSSNGVAVTSLYHHLDVLAGMRKIYALLPVHYACGEKLWQ